MAITDESPAGLRERQKSRRRRDILDAAKVLFETDGYDATTMARIADRAQVSTPTVFNYFGSKDELIVALVLEIHNHGRAFLGAWRPSPSLSLGELLGEVHCIYADLSMKEVGKRVWRYAEATNIRRPDSLVVRMYADVDGFLISETARFLQDATGANTESTRQTCAFLASVAYRCWNARFHAYIRDPAMSLTAHKQLVRQEMCSLGELVSLT